MEKVEEGKNRKVPGVSSIALQEAHEIFGDVEEFCSFVGKG